MADFCRQCSIEMFDEDFRDLEGLSDREVALCEGCGLTVVDCNGSCMGACTKGHGTIRVEEVEYEGPEAGAAPYGEDGEPEPEEPERKAEWE